MRFLQTRAGTKITAREGGREESGSLRDGERQRERPEGSLHSAFQPCSPWMTCSTHSPGSFGTRSPASSLNAHQRASRKLLADLPLHPAPQLCPRGGRFLSPRVKKPVAGSQSSEPVEHQAWSLSTAGSLKMCDVPASPGQTARASHGDSPEGSPGGN